MVCRDHNNGAFGERTLLKIFPSPGGRGFTLLDKTFFTSRGAEIILSNRVKGRGIVNIYTHSPPPHPWSPVEGGGDR